MGDEIGWSGLKSGGFVREVSEQTSAHYKRGFFAFQVVNMPPLSLKNYYFIMVHLKNTKKKHF